MALRLKTSAQRQNDPSRTWSRLSFVAGKHRYPPEFRNKVLQTLIDLTDLLAMQLPRQPGQKELRYAHLLSGEPDVSQLAPAASAPEASPAARVDQSSRIASLEETVQALREELAAVRADLDAFRQQFY